MGTSEGIWLIECVLGYLRTQDVILSDLNSYTPLLKILAGVIREGDCLPLTDNWTFRQIQDTWLSMWLFDVILLWRHNFASLWRAIWSRRQNEKVCQKVRCRNFGDQAIKKTRAVCKVLKLYALIMPDSFINLRIACLDASSAVHSSPSYFSSSVVSFCLRLNSCHPTKCIYI